MAIHRFGAPEYEEAPLMFVVRIVADEGRVDYKAFSRKQDGERRYNDAWRRTDKEECVSAALFEVAGADDARVAIEAVERDDHSCVTRRTRRSGTAVSVGGSVREKERTRTDETSSPARAPGLSRPPPPPQYWQAV